MVGHIAWDTRYVPILIVWSIIKQSSVSYNILKYLWNNLPALMGAIWGVVVNQFVMKFCGMQILQIWITESIL